MDRRKSTKKMSDWLAQPSSNEREFEYDDSAEALLVMGREAARRVSADTLGAFRTMVSERRARLGEHPAYTELTAVADQGVEALRSLLVDESERGRYLRAMMPMRAFVSRDERRVLLETFAATLCQNAAEHR